jgi:hypothetical protein
LNFEWPPSDVRFCFHFQSFTHFRDGTRVYVSVRAIEIQPSGV